MDYMKLPGAFADWWTNRAKDGLDAVPSDDQDWQALYTALNTGRRMKAGRNYTKRIKIPSQRREGTLRRLDDLLDMAAAESRVPRGSSRALYHAGRTVRRRVNDARGASAQQPSDTGGRP